MARYNQRQSAKGSWVLPVFLVLVILAALAVGFLALGQYLDPFGGRMAENVSVCGVSLGGSLYHQSLYHDLAVLCILSASDLSGMQKDGGGLHLLHDIVAVPCADGILAGTVFL